MARDIRGSLEVFISPTGDWVLHPFTSVEYDAELAEDYGHEDAAAEALEHAAEELVALAEELRAGAIELNINNEEIDSDRPDDFYGSLDDLDE